MGYKETQPDLIIKKGTEVFIVQYSEYQTVDHDVYRDTHFTTNNKKHGYSGTHVIGDIKLKPMK